MNGNIFESIPDTLLSPGTIDTLYHKFSSKHDFSGQTLYGFDLAVNSHSNEQHGTRYMWSFTGTFKAITHPELIDVTKSQCYPLADQHNKCNFLPPCTGLQNTAPPNVIPAYPVNFKRVAPCTCCTCWYKLLNGSPVLSDEIFNSSGTYETVPIYRIPLNEWIFMFKVHAEVAQTTLTKNSFRFFKSIRDQKNATGSLFQPITGKIPNTFIQVEGTTASVNGIFYAAGIDVKSMYITPDDVPGSIPVPKVDFSQPIVGGAIGRISCLELFPNATSIKPIFWTE